MSWRKKAADAAERIVLGKQEQERQKLDREIEAELRKAEKRRKR